MRANETIGCPGKLVAMIAAVSLWIFSTSAVNSDEIESKSQIQVTPDAVSETAQESETTILEHDEDSSASCHFWGNSFSLKFHLKSCPFAQAMNPRHVQFLKSVKEALLLGEKPCRYCLPPYELSVSCKILSQISANNQSDNSGESKNAEITN